MKKSTIILSCLLGASLIGSSVVVARTTPTVDVLFVNPVNPLYKNICDSYDSVYMTIMDMSTEYTLHEYNKDLIGGILEFLNTDVGNIKSISLSDHQRSIHVEDNEDTKMDIVLTADLNNVDKISIRGKSPDFLALYIETILEYDDCGVYDVQETKTIGGNRKITMKDVYYNNISYILVDDEFVFEIETNPEYTQAKAIYSFTQIH